jgi:hypothetical protein
MYNIQNGIQTKCTTFKTGFKAILADEILTPKICKHAPTQTQVSAHLQFFFCNCCKTFRKHAHTHTHKIWWIYRYYTNVQTTHNPACNVMTTCIIIQCTYMWKKHSRQITEYCHPHIQPSTHEIYIKIIFFTNQRTCTILQFLVAIIANTVLLVN